MLVRVTGRTLAYSAVAALEDALTKDVADTVMSRALRGEGNTGAHAAQGPGSASGMGVARMSPPPSKRTAARDTQLTAGKSSSRQLRSFRKVHALEVQGSVHSASGRLGDVTQQGGDGAVLMSSAESGVSNQLTTADFMDVDAWKGAIAETVPPLPYLKEYCNVSLVFTGEMPLLVVSVLHNESHKRSAQTQRP